PATESTTALYDALVPPAQAWFASASYGRTALDVTPIHTWFRMPRPSTTYVTRENPSFELHRELMQAAVTAADPSVDFAGYQLLYVVASWPSGIDFSPGFTPIRPEFGVTADGNTLANGVLFGGDARDATPDAAAATPVHETLHTFGLPDLWDFAQAIPVGVD